MDIAGSVIRELEGRGREERGLGLRPGSVVALVSTLLHGLG